MFPNGKGRALGARLSNYSQRKQNDFNADDLTAQCRERAEARGIIPPDNIPFNEIVHCPIEGKGRGNRSGRLFLRSDGSGWLCNYTDGLGVENFQPTRSRSLTPAERARIAESIKRSNRRKWLLGWARRKARINGRILHNWNLAAFWASERLKRDPNNTLAADYQARAYHRLTRLESVQDMLLSKDVGDILEVYRAEKGNP